MDLKLQDKCVDAVKQKTQSQNLKIRVDLESKCTSYKGIEAIKEALTAAEQCNIKVKHVAAPEQFI